MPESPEHVLRRYYQAVWVEGRLDVLDDLLAPNYCDHDPPPGYSTDRRAARRFAEAFVSGIGEPELTILALIAATSHASAHWQLEWTQHGPLLGDPTAAGRRLRLRGADLVRAVGGQIAEIYHVEKMLQTLR